MTVKLVILSALVLAPLSLLSPSLASGMNDLDPVHERMTLKEVEAVLSHRLHASTRDKAPELSRHLFALCEEYKFDPAFVLSLIDKESTFNPRAKSFVGAVGLMQLLPSTAKYIAERIDFDGYRRASDLRNPFVNLTLGVAYLSYLRGRFPASQQFLAAYNMGPTAVGRMVHRQAFKLGAVKSYVLGIQNGRHSMKRAGIRMVSAQVQ